MKKQGVAMHWNVIATISVFVVALALLPANALAQTANDLSGFWTRGGGGGGGGAAEGGAEGGRGGATAMSQWSAKPIPFTPAGLAKFNANKPGKGPRQGPPALGNDPIGDSNPPGLYRTLIYGRPFEFVQLKGKVLQIFEWGRVWRVIYTDGRKVPDQLPAGPYWYGYSVGKWEGDTLVVETLGLDGRAWLDEWGTPFSDDTRVQERWRRQDNNLELTIRLTDPALFSQPWISDVKRFRLQPDGELTEMIFAPIDEKEFNARIRNPAAGVPNR
jgi:hypothetical protein